jgi:hypothetical protein
MNGGMFSRSISVAPITSSSAGVSCTLRFETLIIYDLVLLFLNY